MSHFSSSLIKDSRNLALIEHGPPPPLPSEIEPPNTQQQRTGDYKAGDNGLKYQRTLHIHLGPVSAPPILQRTHDNDEDSTEKLAPGPADDGAHFRAGGPSHFDEVLEGDGDEGEGGCAQDGEDDVGRCDGGGWRGEDEAEVG